MPSRAVRTLLFLVLVASAGARAQNVFVPVKEPDLLGDVTGLFTTGGQYRDPNNGVLQNSWSMLARWQGDGFVANAVSYDMGAFTAFHVPAPTTQWQRGVQPESPAGTPGVQLHGYEGGMLINTWSVPHRFIEGGGYNDMFGYAFAAGSRPDVFVMRNGYGAPIGPAQLVVQASIAVPWFASWANVNGSWVQSPNSGDYGDGQAALFAYLEDTSHPGLPPIAILGLLWGNRWGGCASTGGVAFDYPAGVWFGASGICTTDITTAFYSTPTQQAPFADQRFFRIHVTPQNWTNLVTRVNSAGPANPDPSLRCTPGVSCPPTGYSTDPAAWRLQYAGVISEVSLLENNVRTNESAVRQASMGTDVYGVGIYQSN